MICSVELKLKLIKMKEIIMDFIVELDVKNLISDSFDWNKEVDTFLKNNEKAMNYNQCCKSDSELLKDKENLSFKGWMRVKGYEKNLDEPWLKDGKICTGSEIRYMLELYKAL